ncbi:hypothetical protein HDU98_006006 [Podochytrium sp. JEL0797]|nr:hypothetical protein HDU98_006006 [Podochytrium sp. JEL0797]
MSQHTSVSTKRTVTTTAADGAKSQTTMTHTATVKSLLDEFADLKLQEDPFSCAQFGIRKYENLIFDMSKEGAIKGLRERQRLQEAVLDFQRKSGSQLSSEEAAEVAFLLEAVETDIVSMGIPGEKGYFLELQNNHMDSPFAYLEMMFEEYQRVEDRQDLENCRKRLELVGPQFDFMIENFRSGIRRGITLNAEGVALLAKNKSIYLFGNFGLPDYEEEYSKLIYANTNVRYDAAEIHDIGVAEEKMRLNFNKFPKFDCGVQTIPEYMEAQTPLAFYMPGTTEKRGNFMVNMALHAVKPFHTKTALCLHEAIPGHHHQVSLANENEGLHLATRLSFQTSYAEGLALYCEHLGEEMGFYDDAFQYFGRLEEEMFRAVRLVVDSRLHAKGWGSEQAVAYMQSKVSHSVEEITSEVKRYCVIPGQALAYKVGEMKIKQSRRFAEHELGDQFDIKAFHDQVLDYGSLPLGTLEKVVKKWVVDVKGRRK